MNRFDEDINSVFQGDLIWTPRGWELTVHLINEDGTELLIFEREEENE